MNHFTTDSYWDCYNKLPGQIQELAGKQLNLLKQNPKLPSLNLKLIGKYLSVRIGIKYRALGINNNDDIIWFWIGSHSDYDRLINK